jgi:hypothetical protein
MHCIHARFRAKKPRRTNVTRYTLHKEPGQAVSENLLFLAMAALVCLPLSLILAAGGLPMTSALLLFSPPKRFKVFRDKYGQQTATFCLLAGVASAVFLAGGGILVRSACPAAASFWLGWPLPIAPLTGCLALSGALALAYRAAWQGLKNNKAAHACLGLGASLAAWILGYLFVSFFRHFAVSPAGPGLDPSLFLPPLASAAWPHLPLVWALSLTMAGASTSLYLIHRRDKDDFGRDYYNYSLKLACKWSLFSALGAMAALAWLAAMLWPAVRNLPVRTEFFWGESTGLGCLVMACLLWGLVLKSRNPLRLKLHCVSAAILAWIALTGMAVGSVKFFLG